eukprot:3939869-Rhodomonas_salina.1
MGVTWHCGSCNSRPQQRSNMSERLFLDVYPTTGSKYSRSYKHEADRLSFQMKEYAVTVLENEGKTMEVRSVHRAWTYKKTC